MRNSLSGWQQYRATLTIAEIASVTGVTSNDVRAWIDECGIETIGMGSQRVVRVSELLAHLGPRSPVKVTLSAEEIARARETR